MAVNRSAYWKKKVIRHWSLLDKLSRKRFPDTNTADEALLYVMNKLETDDWQCVRAYRHEADFRTYLSFVAQNLLESFSRHKFGDARPPKWIKRQGSLWIEIYHLLCIERMSATDAVQSLTYSAPGERFSQAVEETVAIILSRVRNCGKYRGEPVPTDTENIDAYTPDHPLLHHFSPEDIAALRERISILEAIAHHLIESKGNSESDFSDNDRIGNLIRRFRSELNIKAEDRLFLKLIYQDGLTVSEAGRLLEWNSNQTHGRLRRLLERIRRAFEKTGLEEELKLLLKSDPGTEFENF